MGFLRDHAELRDGYFCNRGYAVKVRWWDLEWILRAEGQGLMVPIKSAVKGSKCFKFKQICGFDEIECLRIGILRLGTREGQLVRSNRHTYKQGLRSEICEGDQSEVMLTT